MEIDIDLGALGDSIDSLAAVISDFEQREEALASFAGGVEGDGAWQGDAAGSWLEAADAAGTGIAEPARAAVGPRFVLDTSASAGVNAASATAGDSLASVASSLHSDLDMAWVAVPFMLIGIYMLRYRIVYDDAGIHIRRLPFLPNRSFRYEDVDAVVATMKRTYIFSRGRKAYSYEMWAVSAILVKSGAPSSWAMLRAHGVRCVECFKDEDYPDDLPPRSWWSTLDDRRRMIFAWSVLAVSMVLMFLFLFLVFPHLR